MKMQIRPASRQMKLHAWKPATQLCLTQLTQDSSTKQSAPAVMRAGTRLQDLLCQVGCGPHLEAYEQAWMGLSQRCEVSASQLERLFTLALLHQLLEFAAAGRNTESDDISYMRVSGSASLLVPCTVPCGTGGCKHVQDGSSLVMGQHLRSRLRSTLQCFCSCRQGRMSTVVCRGLLECAQQMRLLSLLQQGNNLPRSSGALQARQLIWADQQGPSRVSHQCGRPVTVACKSMTVPDQAGSLTISSTP